MEVPAIELNKLSKTYSNSPFPAVNDVSFLVPGKSIFGLLGPNGAGKTTIISILCGLIKPSSGDAVIAGLRVNTDFKRIKQIIGVVPQDIALYPTLTAYENLRFIGNMYGLKGLSLQNRINSLLEKFGLVESRDKLIEKFSGGMKRRINLIAGILHQPEILFLDEPTVGIDVQSRKVIIDFLLELNGYGTTIIYSSHLMEEAENLCSEIQIIDKGSSLLSGSPSHLIATHGCKDLEDLFLKFTGRNLRN